MTTKLTVFFSIIFFLFTFPADNPTTPMTDLSEWETTMEEQAMLLSKFEQEKNIQKVKRSKSVSATASVTFAMPDTTISDKFQRRRPDFTIGSESSEDLSQKIVGKSQREGRSRAKKKGASSIVDKFLSPEPSNHTIYDSGFGDLISFSGDEDSNNNIFNKHTKNYVEDLPPPLEKVSVIEAEPVKPNRSKSFSTSSSAQKSSYVDKFLDSKTSSHSDNLVEETLNHIKYGRTSELNQNKTYRLFEDSEQPLATATNWGRSYEETGARYEPPVGRAVSPVWSPRTWGIMMQ